MLGLDVQAIFAEALADPSTYDTVSGLLQRVSDNDELYARVVADLRSAASPGAILALLDLAQQLRDASLFGDRDPLSDLTAGLTFAGLTAAAAGDQPST